MKIEFEWDAAKARENKRKHGVSFEFATHAFLDPFALDWIDDSESDEERTILLAMAKGILLVVVFTERGNRTRLISARRATKHEQDNYYSENDA